MHILDVGLVVPLMLLAARWLGRRQPWGVVAASVLLVKGVTVGLGLLAANAFAVLGETPSDGPLAAVWLCITASGAWALVVLLRPAGPGPASDGSAAATGSSRHPRDVLALRLMPYSRP